MPGLREFFRLGQENETEPKKTKKEGEKLPVETSEVAELRAERREKEFDFETAVNTKEKAPGEGEDRTIVYNDNEKSLFAVLDGMGGQKGGGGDVAAQIVSESFQKAMAKESNLPKDSRKVEELMKNALISAHKELKDSPVSAIYENMGTTFAAMLNHGDKATVVSSGDSLIYRLRQGKLECLTPEDSVIGVLKTHGIEVSTAVLSENLPDGTARDVTLSDALKRAKEVPPTKKYSEDYINLLINNFGSFSLKKLRNVMPPRTGLNAGKETEKEKEFADKLGAPEWEPHVLTVDVRDGDEFLLTTDGLIDNCPVGILNNDLNKMSGLSAEEIAANLMKTAVRMQDKNNNPDANKKDDVSIIYIKSKRKKENREEEITEISPEELEEIEEISPDELEEVGT